MSLLNQRNRKNLYTKREDIQIVTLYNEGKSIAEIAKALGRSEASISYRIYRKLAKVDSIDALWGKENNKK